MTDFGIIKLTGTDPVEKYEPESALVNNFRLYHDKISDILVPTMEIYPQSTARTIIDLLRSTNETPGAEREVLKAIFTDASTFEIPKQTTVIADIPDRNDDGMHIPFFQYADKQKYRIAEHQDKTIEEILVSSVDLKKIPVGSASPSVDASSNSGDNRSFILKSDHPGVTFPSETEAMFYGFHVGPQDLENHSVVLHGYLSTPITISVRDGASMRNVVLPVGYKMYVPLPFGRIEFDSNRKPKVFDGSQHTLLTKSEPQSSSAPGPAPSNVPVPPVPSFVPVGEPVPAPSNEPPVPSHVPITLPSNEPPVPSHVPITLPSNEPPVPSHVPVPPPSANEPTKTEEEQKKAEEEEEEKKKAEEEEEEKKKADEVRAPELLPIGEPVPVDELGKEDEVRGPEAAQSPAKSAEVRGPEAAQSPTKSAEVRGPEAAQSPAKSSEVRPSETLLRIGAPKPADVNIVNNVPGAPVTPVTPVTPDMQRRQKRLAEGETLPSLVKGSTFQESNNKLVFEPPNAVPSVPSEPSNEPSLPSLVKGTTFQESNNRLTFDNSRTTEPIAPAPLVLPALTDEAPISKTTEPVAPPALLMPSSKDSTTESVAALEDAEPDFEYHVRRPARSDLTVPGTMSIYPTNVDGDIEIHGNINKETFMKDIIDLFADYIKSEWVKNGVKYDETKSVRKTLMGSRLIKDLINKILENNRTHFVMLFGRKTDERLWNTFSKEKGEETSFGFHFRDTDTKFEARIKTSKNAHRDVLANRIIEGTVGLTDEAEAEQKEKKSGKLIVVAARSSPLRTSPHPSILDYLNII